MFLAVQNGAFFSEARYNRTCEDRQILICPEWRIGMCGDAQLRSGVRAVR